MANFFQLFYAKRCNVLRGGYEGATVLYIWGQRSVFMKLEDFRMVFSLLLPPIAFEFKGSEVKPSRPKELKYGHWLYAKLFIWPPIARAAGNGHFYSTFCLWSWLHRYNFISLLTSYSTFKWCTLPLFSISKKGFFLLNVWPFKSSLGRTVAKKDVNISLFPLLQSWLWSSSKIRSPTKSWWAWNYYHFLTTKSFRTKWKLSSMHDHTHGNRRNTSRLGGIGVPPWHHAASYKSSSRALCPGDHTGLWVWKGSRILHDRSER